MLFIQVNKVYFGNHMKHSSTMCIKNTISSGELHQVVPQLPLVFKGLKLPSPSIHKHILHFPAYKMHFFSPKNVT
jgi:hypothetical protein